METSLCAWGGSSSLKTASRDARWGLSPYRVTEEDDLVGRRSGTLGAVWLYAVSNVDEAVHLRRLRGACSSGSRSTSGGETPHSSVRRFVHERDHLRDVVFLVFVVRIEDDMKSRRNI